MKTDPITLEVLRSRFEAVAEEMQDALIRSSYSSIVKESFDASSALMDAAGETIAQATAQPAHLGMLVASVKRLLDEFPASTMRAGDAFVMNDPYDGGTHLPDVTVVVPVIVDGETVALACSMSHHQDLGGKVPGSCPTDSTEIYQEGLIIPPLRLYTAGQPNDTFFRLLRRNVRIPDIVTGDLRAQVACGRVGATRMEAVVRDYGAAVVRQATAELFERAEAMTRDAIRALPDGTYRFHDYLDDDGVELGRRVRLEAAVTIQGSELAVEFTGTDPQTRGPINCVPSSTLAVVYYVVTAIADPSIPTNAGCQRPLTVDLPKGSVLNCAPPAAVNARSLTMKRLADVLLGALVPAVPTRIPAASGQHCVIYFGGRDPSSGAAYVSARIIVGGMGARPTKDGIDAVETDLTNTKNNPAEAAEADFPIRVLSYRLRENSGGPGQYRGGLGVEQVIRVMRGEATISHRGDRFTTPPWGLLGGKPGAQWRSVVVRANGDRITLSSKVVLTLREGDELQVFSGGGGGYGDPLERDPALVLDDVLGRKVSVAIAREEYGVVLTPSFDHVDEPATVARRQQLREARGPIRWTWDRGAELGRA
jgi:N-methylhydantoinase B